MGNCIPVGPEAIPAGQCRNDKDEFLGSSGFRLIPGNTCDRQRGIKKDDKKMKPCHAGKENPGLVSHQSVSLWQCLDILGCPNLTPVMSSCDSSRSPASFWIKAISATRT